MKKALQNHVESLEECVDCGVSELEDVLIYCYNCGYYACEACYEDIHIHHDDESLEEETP